MAIHETEYTSYKTSLEKLLNKEQARTNCNNKISKGESDFRSCDIIGIKNVHTLIKKLQGKQRNKKV